MNIKNLAFTIVYLLFATISFCQTTQIKYFSDKRLEKETTQEKAKFKQTITKNVDGSQTEEAINVKNNEVIHTFNLVYTVNPCADTIAGVTKYFEDKDSLNYLAPKIATGEKTIFDFIGKGLRYPAFARENDIQGRVLLSISINSKGDITELAVKEGVHVSLDREAVRIMQKLKLSAPAYFKGQPKAVCFTMPINFRLE